MSRPTVEVADLLRTHGERFVAENQSWLSYQQLKVLRAIQRCRTAALGGHLDQCPGVVIRPSLSTPAGIGTVRSVRRKRVNDGSPAGNKTYSACLTSMWCSHCLTS